MLPQEKKRTLTTDRFNNHNLAIKLLSSLAIFYQISF